MQWLQLISSSSFSPSSAKHHALIVEKFRNCGSGETLAPVYLGVLEYTLLGDATTSLLNALDVDMPFDKAPFSINPHLFCSCITEIYPRHRTDKLNWLPTDPKDHKKMYNLLLKSLFVVVGSCVKGLTLEQALKVFAQPHLLVNYLYWPLGLITTPEFFAYISQVKLSDVKAAVGGWIELPNKAPTLDYAPGKQYLSMDDVVLRFKRSFSDILSKSPQQLT